MPSRLPPPPPPPPPPTTTGDHHPSSSSPSSSTASPPEFRNELSLAPVLHIHGYATDPRGNGLLLVYEFMQKVGASKCPLFAKIGPVCIFKEPIGPERMARLASRGGDELPAFGSAGTFRRPAQVLGQGRVATRMRPVEALWTLAYGDPMSLLPLVVANIDKDSLEPQLGALPLSLATTNLAAPIFCTTSRAIQHPGNSEELCRVRGHEFLSRLLDHLLQTLSAINVGRSDGVADQGPVAAILLIYGLQKKLLSSLADMVFTESSVMRDANAVQVLLDGCRKCYWTIREKDSVDNFSLNDTTRPVGEVNALVDELLVMIQLLIGSAPPSIAADDIRHSVPAWFLD